MADVPDVDPTLASGAKPNAKYDIFNLVAPYFDVHITLNLLDFVAGLGIYDPKDVAIATYELSRSTKMIDFAIEKFKLAYGEDAPIPQTLLDQRDLVTKVWGDHMAAVEPFMQFFDSNGHRTTLLDELLAEGRFNADELRSSYGITEATIEALFTCAKFRYECGEYEESTRFLAYYRVLVPEESDKYLKALWGLLTGHIAHGALKEAEDIKEILMGVLRKRPRDMGFTELQLLQHRSWLLHHALLIFSASASSADAEAAGAAATAAASAAAKDKLIEFFTVDTNLNAVQLNCPWLLRYLATAILTSRKRVSFTKTLLRIISQEASAYRDPIIEFLDALLTNFDFEAAQAKLAECESVIVGDYFLSSLTNPTEFMECARRFIFETYCRVHNVISLETLATKLHMSEAEAEKWVVELIRNAGIDARIDSTERRVVMTPSTPSVYQQIVDKTRELVHRTRALAENIESAAGDAAAGASSAAGATAVGGAGIVGGGGGGGYAGAARGGAGGAPGGGARPGGPTSPWGKAR